MNELKSIKLLFIYVIFQLGECLGQGEFGPVMRGVAKALGQHAEVEVAVKLLVSEAMGEGEEEEGGGFRADLAVTDYSNQMKLRHRNVVPILGICSDIEPYYIIYEYLDKVSLVWGWNYMGVALGEER